MPGLTWIWTVFVFALGACVGSFLNVVVYRLPREKSLVTPPSSCPACGKRIRFYDNIPLLSWIALGAKCRNCKSPISVRYFLVELLTAIVFTGLFLLYFRSDIRTFVIGGEGGIIAFLNGGWLILLVMFVLAAGLIASSAIDLELWVIPISICWVVTAAGLIGSAMAPFLIDIDIIHGYDLLPAASAKTGILAAGAALGLIISMLLLFTGVIKPSYYQEHETESEVAQSQIKFNDRLEACREIVFLLPIIICSAAALWLYRQNPVFNDWWVKFSQIPPISGFLGSLWGYFIGCGVVWATRIFGTLAFGKEAMGLGDVHLMGAAGAVIGPLMAIVAFFVAPFFGLLWAAVQMFFKKVRQIPYGPFLSMGILVVIILHDRILNYFNNIFYQSY
ncbi:MAG: prepilin peptidase [Phycisphaerae bacterium]|nr:prepilin peptidase [Phycisphaerae bacterium]